MENLYYEGRLANSRSRLISKLDSIIERVKKTADALGFESSKTINLDGGKLVVRAGGVSATITAYDEDDLSISVPKTVADKLNVSSYVSANSVSEAKNFLKMLEKRISQK